MWPAPRSTRGTATTDAAPRSTNRSTAASRSGSASSMKPQPTSGSGAASVTTLARSQYSATPAAERLPWPTMSSAGWSAMPTPREPEEGVEGGGGDCAPALLANIADGRQPAGPQPFFGLGCADETD